MEDNKQLQNFLRKHAKAITLAERLKKRIRALTVTYMKRLNVKGTLRKQLKIEAFHHMENVDEIKDFLDHLRKVGVSDATKEKESTNSTD